MRCLDVVVDVAGSNSKLRDSFHDCVYIMVCSRSYRAALCNSTYRQAPSSCSFATNIVSATCIAHSCVQFFDDRPLAITDRASTYLVSRFHSSRKILMQFARLESASGSESPKWNHVPARSFFDAFTTYLISSQSSSHSLEFVVDTF